MKQLLCLLLCVPFLFLCGCKKDSEAISTDNRSDWESIVEEGKVKIGVLQSATCQSGEAGGKSGFDIDLIQMVCKELSLRYELIDVPVGSETTMLHDKVVDCVWGTLYRPTLEDSFDCSIPYLVDDQVVVFSGNNGASFETMDDLKKVGTVTAVKDSPAQTAAIDAGISVVESATATEAMRRVLGGSDTLCLIGYADALPFLNDPDYASLQVGLTVASYNRVILYPKDSYLNKTVRNALKKFNENGTLDQLADKYKLFNQVPSNHS